MPHFVVSYTYSPSTSDGRDTFRAEHREWLRGLLDDGVLVVSGPFTDDSGALIVVKGDDAAAVRSLFENDPFAREELLEASSVTEWKPVMGALT